VATATDPGHVRTLLEGVPGVALVEAPTEATEPWRASVAPGPATSDVTAAIVDTLVAAGVRLTALREAQPSLERIYRRAVAQTDVAYASGERTDRPPRTDRGPGRRR
ncbi:MAG TPA: hypothetical protein VIV06_05185, partial [Candidatus Limnocylindrales bacterium]